MWTPSDRPAVFRFPRLDDLADRDIAVTLAAVRSRAGPPGRGLRRLTRRTTTWPCLLVGRPFGHPGLDVERAVDDSLSAPVLLQDHRSSTGSGGANTLPVTYFGWRCAGLRPPRAYYITEVGRRKPGSTMASSVSRPPAITLPARTRPVSRQLRCAVTAGRITLGSLRGPAGPRSRLMARRRNGVRAAPALAWGCASPGRPTRGSAC